MPVPLWVDCDIALGAPRGDVDDGFALAVCALAPEVELRGVSTVFGNTSALQASSCAERLLAVLLRRVPVLRGADRPGAVVPAVVDALTGLPAGAQLLCLGPLSNLAAALVQDPALLTRVTVWLVGGNLDSRGRSPPYWPFEFNLAKDPAATRLVFQAPGRRRLFPLPLCRRLRVGPLRLWSLAASSPVGAYLSRGSLRWLAYAPLRYQSLRFPLWDTVPALALAAGLPVRYAERRLVPYGRGGLRQAPGACVTECAEDVDEGRAFELLLALCRMHRPEAPPASMQRPFLSGK